MPFQIPLTNLVVQKAAPLWKEIARYGLIAVCSAFGWELGKTIAVGSRTLIAEGHEALQERYLMAKAMAELKRAEKLSRQAEAQQARPTG